MNALDAARRQRPEAVDARIVRHVNGGILQAGAPARTVADRIDFTVNDGLFMIVAHAANVRGTGNKPVVAHGNDTIAFYDHGAHTQPGARAAHGCQKGNGHEVVVPRHGVFVF